MAMENPLGLKTVTVKKSYKKPILMGIASVAGLVLLAAAAWYLNFILQFSLYQDDTYKFSIKYPKQWKVIAHPQKDVAVFFVKPKDTALDTMQENFNVTVQPVPMGEQSMAVFSAAIKKQMTAVFNNIKVVQDKAIQIGWRPGHQIIFTAAVPDHFELFTAWVLRADTAYIMTFLGDMNKFKNEKPIIDEMISSLKVQ